MPLSLAIPAPRPQQVPDDGLWLLHELLRPPPLRPSLHSHLQQKEEEEEEVRKPSLLFLRDRTLRIPGRAAAPELVDLLVRRAAAQRRHLCGLRQRPQVTRLLFLHPELLAVLEQHRCLQVPSWIQSPHVQKGHQTTMGRSPQQKRWEMDCVCCFSSFILSFKKKYSHLFPKQKALAPNLILVDVGVYWCFH